MTETDTAADTATGPATWNTPFRNVLAVWTPGEEADETLQAAIGMADAWTAGIAVHSTVELPPDIHRIAHTAGVSPEEIESRLIDDRKQEISGALLRIAPDREIDVYVRVGKPFLEIIRHVMDHGVDLVIKTAEELDRTLHLFASTDQHLLRKCPCPVWLRLGDGSRPVRTVLAAVDVDDAMVGEGDALAGLNRRIIETAMRIAGSEAAVIHVLHVWEAPGEGLVRMLSGAPDGKRAAEEYVSEVQADHWQALERLVEAARTLAGAGRIEILPALERGAARDVIPEQVHMLKADVLVMGTIARTGVPGFIIGNTAEDILNRIDCSVVTVKPPDYVSPVAG